MTSCSPYLDPRLFSYNTKHIQPVIGWHDANKQPINFRLAQYDNRPRTVFELVASATPSVPGPGGQSYACRMLNLFHPIDPFIMTVVQTLSQAPQLNIYYRE